MQAMRWLRGAGACRVGREQLENTRERRRVRKAASRRRIYVGAKAPTYKTGGGASRRLFVRSRLKPRPTRIIGRLDGSRRCVCPIGNRGRSPREGCALSLNPHPSHETRARRMGHPENGMREWRWCGRARHPPPGKSNAWVEVVWKNAPPGTSERCARVVHPREGVSSHGVRYRMYKDIRYCRLVTGWLDLKRWSSQEFRSDASSKPPPFA